MSRLSTTLLLLMLCCCFWPSRQQSTAMDSAPKKTNEIIESSSLLIPYEISATPSLPLETENLIIESALEDILPTAFSSFIDVAISPPFTSINANPMEESVSTQLLIEPSTSMISVGESSGFSEITSSRSLTLANIINPDPSSGRMASVTGKPVPETETIETPQQKVDKECSSEECLDRHPKENTTPTQGGFESAGSVSLHRQNDGVDVPDVACQERATRRERFLCVNVISSCHGHCGEILDSCSCDVNCGVYNVCCDDFEDICPAISEDAKKSLGGLLDVNIECVGEYTSYLVIAGCPEDYTNSSRRKECEDGKVLINSVGGLQFKNVACLRCQGFTESVKWTKSVFVNYGRGKQLSYFAVLDANEVTKTSPLVWKVPQPFINVSRVCSRDIIDECPKESDIYLSEKCSTSNANVYINSGNATNVYKNVYCAYCNLDSILLCRGTFRYDYDSDIRFGRFSAIITMKFDTEADSFKLEATTPFLWREAKCRRTDDDLRCELTKCMMDFPLDDEGCGLQMTDTCVWMEFLTNSRPSKDNLMHFRSLLTNVSNSHPYLKVSISIYALDYTKGFLAMKLSFTVWTGLFPYTLDDLYDTYSEFTIGFLTALELKGEFSLCFNMAAEKSRCSNMECEARNYTIQGSPDQGSISSGGERLLSAYFLWTQPFWLCFWSLLPYLA